MELAHIIFPDRAKQGRLSVQDNSDLIHLATAILPLRLRICDRRERASQQRRSHRESLRHKGRARPAFGAATGKDKAEGDYSRDKVWRKRTASFGDDRPSSINISAQSLKIQLSDDIRVHVAASDVRSSHNRSLAVSFDDSLVCAALWDCSAMLRNYFVVTVIADEDHPAIDSAARCVVISGSA